MMTPRKYQTSIPAGAVERVEELHPGGAKKSASFWLDEVKVGYREWDEDGRLEFECTHRNGVKHGHEYCFHANGQLLEKETYRKGYPHGTGKQWSEDGRLLVTWKLVNGTGLDLWCDLQTEGLAEEHYWPREGELGYKRLWNGDEQTVRQEYFYLLGKGYHGVWREWNAQGRMRRGFPQFYVNGRKVLKLQYLKVCASDLTLPPYRPEDDDQHRLLPGQYLAQRNHRR
jgi:hypothetical protein